MMHSMARRRRDVARVFLETTIQIDRFLESRERRVEIRKNLVGKELCTSSYVRMEFQRTILKDLDYVLSTVDSEPVMTVDRKVSLERLLREVLRRQGEHAGRRIDRCCKIIAWLMEVFEHSLVKKAKIIEFLNDQMEDLRDEFFEVDLTAEGGEIVNVNCSDFTDCTLVKTGKCHCRREEAQCQLPGFLAKNAYVLEEVKRAFEAVAKQPTMTSSATRILTSEPVNWNLAKGQGNCWPLGDTIIALESPPDSALYTTDRHYDVICPIVGRFLYDEPFVSFRTRRLKGPSPNGA